MLQSLQACNPREDLAVFLIYADVDPVELGTLVTYLNGFLPSVSFLRADPHWLEGFHVSGHATVATYFRLLLPSILPAALERAIFIDSDAIVSASLEELWQMPLHGRALAAVAEHMLSCRDHGYVHGEYFNAGVMLVDLDQWRRAQVLPRGREFARANPDRLRHWDQDVLNHVFTGEWLALEDRWNACPHLFGLNGDYDLSPEALTDSEREAIANPAIIHFAGPGPVKPWDARCLHPLRDRYRQASAMTPWASVLLDNLPPPALVKAWQQAVFRTKSVVKGLVTGA
jgi:lipopolysaccharide biosynthesis glycosyltransferase